MISSYLNVNFQPATFQTVLGYEIDSFEAFGTRTNGFDYGWVLESSVLDADGTTATPVDPSQYPSNAVTARSGPVFEGLDPRLASYAHFDLPTYPARAAWEVAAPNGFYEVTVAVGDTAGPLDSIYDLEIEGVTASQFTPISTFRTELSVVTVDVTDGFLTLAAPAGTITEIQYLEIRELEDLTPTDGNPAPLDYPSFINLRAAAQDGNEVFETPLDPATGFASGVDPAADIFLGVSTVPGRTGVSLDSLSDGSIRLYETLTGIEVSYSANTTAGADSITITPDAQLAENTSYTLVVEGAIDQGPIDNASAPAREFQKVATTFVTGQARDPQTGTAAFTDTLELDGFADGAFGFTSVELSTDGTKLYASNIIGEVKSWDLDPVTGAIDPLSVETFAPGGDFDTASGRRGIIGLTTDPTDPNVLWISDNWPIPLEGRDNSVPEFSGRISKIEMGPGGDLATATITPYITGLPRSNGDHVVNSLEFRVNPDAGQPGEPSHLLYTNIGSNTAMGAPDSAWGLRPERLLSAATLEIDPYRTPPPGGFDVTSEPIPQDGLNRRFADADNDLKNGGIAIDSGPFTGNFLHFDANGVASVRDGADVATSTLFQTFYDPFAPDAVVKVFATGARNAYDLVWHSDGSLYVPTNGSAAGGNAPDDPATPTDESLNNISIRPDYLFRMEESGYYGHPNPLHDQYVLNGGNPTAGVDFAEVVDYAEGIDPDLDYDAADIYDLGFSRSPNGAVEYTSDAWGAALQGALLFTEYSGGNGIRAVTFDGTGGVDEDFVLRDFDGNLIDGYVDPLDITINPATGQLYFVTLNRASGESQLVRLDPTPPPTRIEAENMTIVQGFSVTNNGAASGGAQLQATGNGPQEASLTWTGPSGLYTLSIGHFDENDGIAQLFTRVDGALVDAFYWDQDRGTPNGNAAAATQESLPEVFLQNGATLSFEGLSNAGEQLRFDYIDVSFTRQVDGSEAAPTTTLPAVVTMSANTTFDFAGPDEVSVTDADSTQLTTTVSVTEGTLSLTGVAGVDVFGDGTGEIILSGNAAALDESLVSLSYTPDFGFSGSDTVTVTTTDGHLTDVATTDVTVTPFGDPDADIAIEVLEPSFVGDRLHFSYIDEPGTNSGSRPDRSFKDEGTVRLSNEGTADLDILSHVLDGPFVLANPTQLDGLTLAPGASVDVTVLFDRASFQQRINNEDSVFTGSLVLNTNDQEDNQVTIDLAGTWQRVDEGSWEPNINEIWDVFGFGNELAGLPFVDSEATPLDQGGIYQKYDDTEVLSPYWKIADGETEATVTHIAQYAGPGGGVEIAIHRPLSLNTKLILLDSQDTDTQRILPEIRAGGSFAPAGTVIDPVYSQATFTRAQIPDSWPGDDIFGFDIVNYSSDPDLNRTGNVPDVVLPESVDGQWTRIYHAFDGDGVAIPNTYLAVQDYFGSNGDYNDNLMVLQGIAPASSPPEVIAPAVITVAEDGSFAFTGPDLISLTDPDLPPLTREYNVVLRADNGTLSATAVGDTTVSGSGTGELVIDGQRGSVSETLQTLETISYAPDADFAGADTIRVAANDSALPVTAEIAVTVTEGDDDAPVAVDATAPTLTVGGGTEIDVSVTYTDDRALDFTSFDAADITVRAPDDTILAATAASVAPDGTDRAVVTYTVPASGGTWDGLDNGTYTVQLVPGEVLDDGANAVSAADIGTFEVDISLGDPVRLEAEAMSFTSGFSITSNFAASGGQILQANSDDEQRASFVFSETDGTYQVTIGYFDETDGISQMSLVVNGFEIESFDWDSTTGAANGNTASFTTYEIEGVTLRNGDLVELVGTSDGSEPLRTDYLEVVRVGPLGADTVAPVIVSADAPDVAFADAGTPETVVTVTYADDVALDVATVDVTDISVTGPGGALTVTGASVDQPSDGTPRTVSYTVAAPGGTWDPADDGAYDVALAAGAVADTSGNAIAADPALASFAVSTTPPPPAPFRVEAETLTLTAGFGVGSNGAASGGQVISAAAPGPKTAEFVFTAADGVYDVSIGHFDENDGVSSLGLFVNAIEIETWLWDSTAGSALGNADSFLERLIEDVTLRNGDLVELRGTSDGGEPLRTDYLDFTYVSAAGADTVAPVIVSADAPDVAFADAGTPETVVTVTYADDVALDVATVDVTDISVTGPGGALTVTGASVDQPSDGTPRTVSYTVAAPGGTWDPADDGAYDVALAAGAVADTSGNAIAADPALASFAVSTTPPPPAPFRVEAETLTLTAGFGVGSNGAASGGQVISAAAPGPKTAEFVFTAADGVYDVSIGHFDENDGVSSLGLFVNAIEIETWLWDSTAGSALGNADSFLERLIEDVTLRNGDLVELRGTSDGGEPLRTDYLDFTYVSAAGADTVAPVIVSADAPDVAFADAGTPETVVTVTYADDVALDVATVDVTDISVTGPGGALTVTGASVDQPSDGTPRTVSYTVAAPGGTWDPADDGAYDVALAAGAVADTSGNAIAADPALASFAVSTTPPPPAPFRVEAETLTLTAGFGVGSNGAASGGQVISAAAPGPKTAEFVFTAADGVYDVSIGHFDENDGVSSLGLFVNAIEIETWLWDSTAGSALGNADSFLERLIEDVTLRNGDLVELRGTSDGGEPLRTDYLDFTYVSAAGADTVAPVIVSADAPDVAFADAGTPETVVTVTYADDVALDVATVDVTDISVTGPGGALTVTGASVDQPSDGTPRTVSYTVAAPGGTWDPADDGAYDVALAAGAVADTSGNAIAADPALASFAVSTTPPPPAPFRVEAETLTLTAGFGVGSNGAASGGQVISAAAPGPKTAEFVFTAADGVYDVSIGHFDENDGVSSLGLFVNAIEIETWLWDSTAGSALGNADSFLERLIEDVTLRNGDLVELRGTSDGGEPLRTDYFDFVYDSPL